MGWWGREVARRMAGTDGSGVMEGGVCCPTVLVVMVLRLETWCSGSSGADSEPPAPSSVVSPASWRILDNFPESPHPPGSRLESAKA